MQGFDPDMHEIWDTGNIAVCTNWIFFYKSRFLSCSWIQNSMIYLCFLNLSHKLSKTYTQIFWIWYRRNKSTCFECLLSVSKLLKAPEILVLYWRTGELGYLIHIAILQVLVYVLLFGVCFFFFWSVPLCLDFWTLHGQLRLPLKSAWGTKGK